MSPACARTLHPVQQAWIDEQVPQCGYCQSGMMIAAVQLLAKNPNPTVAEIKDCFHQHAALAASLPLRHLRRDHRRGAARRQGHGRLKGTCFRNLRPSHLTLTRRSFVQAGGALFVSLALPRALSAAVGAASDRGRQTRFLARDPKRPYHSRAHRPYRNRYRHERILCPGDCRRITCPAGEHHADHGRYRQDAGRRLLRGFSERGGKRSQGCRLYVSGTLADGRGQLRVPVSALTVTDGMVSGGGNSIAYAQLVQGQQLDLKIPVTGTPIKFAPPGSDGVAGLDWAGMGGLVVTGDPPLKPVSQYKVIGTSFPMPGIPDKVTGQTQWSCDVTLPGMLHARMVRPPALGSTLISMGEVDKTKFPTAKVVSEGQPGRRGFSQ